MPGAPGTDHRSLRCRAPEDRFYPQKQLLGGEGFYDVIVAAQFKAGYAAGFRIPGGKKEQRNVRLLPDSAGHHKATDIREHDVNDDHIWWGKGQRIHSRLSPIKGVNLVILELKVLYHAIPDEFVIFYYI
jgi:hypothetical protein